MESPLLPPAGELCASTHSFELSHFRFTMIEDNKENKDHSSERGRATLIFSLKNEVGGLIKALKIFQVWIFHKAHLKNGSQKFYLKCKVPSVSSPEMAY